MLPFAVLIHVSGRSLNGSLFINCIKYFSGLLFLSVMRIWMRPAKFNQFLNDGGNVLDLGIIFVFSVVVGVNAPH